MKRRFVWFLVVALVSLTAQGLARDRGLARAGAPAWTTVASLPTPRTHLAVSAGLDGRIYAITGDLSHLAPTNIVEAYDPATNTWSAVASAPTSRLGAAAATGLDDRIYVFGGQVPALPTNVAEAYDPATNTWATLAPMPTARSTPAVATGLDGRVFVMGGSAYGVILDVVEVYDPVADSWSTASSMPTPQNSDHGATRGPDGRIYVVGGYYPPGSNTFHPGLAQVYTPATDSWWRAADMPTGRIALAAATGTDGGIYAISGSNGAFLTTVEVYDPAANGWSTGPSLDHGRYTHGAASLADGRIYVVGGGNGASKISAVECLALGATPCLAPSAVGGIADLPALAGASAGEAGAVVEESGNSVAYALAAGVAAAVVVVGAGAWYARRRWLR